MATQKTVIVTGASQGIGEAVVQAFLDRGYNVVATSRGVSNGFAPSSNLALVDGDIGQAATAEKVAQAAIGKFGSIDHVVNNAGIISVKPFTDYTVDEFHSLVSTNLKRFIFITQLAVKQILSQGTGGSVTSITASLVENPIPLQRGRAWRRRHPSPQEQPEGFPEDPFADGHDLRRKGYR